MPAERWQIGQGPGSRRLPWSTRAKRWLVERAVRDARIRRIALNRIFSGHGAEGVLCLVPFEDHIVYVDPRDDRIAYTLLTGRPWQRTHLQAAFDQAANDGRLRSGAVFVDVGANIGLMTLYAMLSGRFERAVAIEPDPWNRTILQRNLEANGIADSVTVIAKAASDVSGTMTLHCDAKNLGAHSLEPQFVMSPAACDQQVAVDRLDTILEEVGVAHGDVSFVKIDVEGHEFAALAGMSQLVLARAPLMIEVTFDAQGGRASIDQLRTLLPNYATIVDVERPEAAKPVNLNDFRPTAAQHELLVY